MSTLQRFFVIFLCASLTFFNKKSAKIVCYVKVLLNHVQEVRIACGKSVHASNALAAILRASKTK